MPGVIDYETIYVDDLPGIWSPVQWELNEEERRRELEEQGTASLLWSVDAPEAVLRLLLAETAIQSVSRPPVGYDPRRQGAWDESLLTFQFTRPIRLARVQRGEEATYVEYDFRELGRWGLEVGSTRVVIERL